MCSNRTAFISKELTINYMCLQSRKHTMTDSLSLLASQPWHEGYQWFYPIKRCFHCIYSHDTKDQMCKTAPALVPRIMFEIPGVFPLVRARVRRPALKAAILPPWHSAARMRGLSSLIQRRGHAPMTLQQKAMTECDC